MTCEYCGREIPIGSYVRYDEKAFCCSECLGDYLIDQVEDEVDFSAYNSSPENDYLEAMEEREAIRKDLEGYYDSEE